MRPIVVQLRSKEGTFPVLSRFAVRMSDRRVVNVHYPITRMEGDIIEYDEKSPVWQVKSMEPKEFDTFKQYMKEAVDGGVFQVVDESQTHLLSAEDRKGWQKVKEELQSD